MSYDPIATIRREADAFLVAARRGLTPQVPGCPDWTVRELTQHLGSVYRFHNRHVTRGITDPPEEWAAELPADEDLLEWFDESCNELLITLRSVDHDSPAWNWAPHTPQTAAFWPRRMALETAVHRWDAESAHRDAMGIDLELALDGIDELLTVMGPTGKSPEHPAGTAVVRPSDADREWAVQLGPNRFELLTDKPAAPDAVLEGTATALLLAMWGREVDITTSGDATIVAVMTA